MNGNSERAPTGRRAVRKWPWWEPYVFTGCLLAAFSVFLTLLDFMARIPLIEHVLFLGMTITAVIVAWRRPLGCPSPLTGTLLAIFFAVLSFTYLQANAMWFGIGYAFLTMIWLFLAVQAGIIRHTARREQLAKLDCAVETLRRAVDEDE